MNTLFPFALAIPEGIYFSAFLVFLFLGVILFLNILRQKEGRYAFPAAVHVAAGVLAILARDIMTLLVAWEVLAFSAFILIRGTGTARGRRISLRYLVIQVTGGVFFFFAALLHFGETGSLVTGILVPSAQPFMVAAILIKTATMPVHFWLTQAYPSVELSITPLLSVYTTKVGVLTAAQLIWISPAGFPVLAWLGAGTAVGAVILALLQHEARKLLSYHIVSQVGYMVAGIGLAAGFSAMAATAGMFHLVTHTLYKALLLLVAAQAVHHRGHEDLTRMGGLGSRRPLLLLCGIIGAAAISGVPFTSGYASKYLLKEASQAQPLVTYLLYAASVGTGLSFIKFTHLLFFNRANPPSSDPSKTRAPSMVPLVLVAGITVLIGLFPHAVPGVPRRAFFTPSSLLSALLPLAASALLWMVLKKRLTRPATTVGRAGTGAGGVHATDTRAKPFPGKAHAPGTRLRRGARTLHNLGPQAQVLLFLLVLAVTAGLLWPR
ncbi:MAG: hypothetical protein EA427_10770 [Spirochaetaceae bacterium]|nr:MAG: hypothetical protein EA427_10770 [Spirochaetaceae bacterium]